MKTCQIYRDAFAKFGHIETEGFTFILSGLQSCRNNGEAEKFLKSFTGSLSAPDKMPCYSFSTPSERCQRGSKLAKIKGSVCFGCYTFGGNYLRPNVKNALQDRFEKLNGKFWAEAMAVHIFVKNKGTHKGMPVDSSVWRWHDSGDIQSAYHIAQLAKIARWMPEVIFWLPTKEKKHLRDYRREETEPANLVIRLSGDFVDSFKSCRNESTRSVVITEETVDLGIPVFVCPATRRHKGNPHQCAKHGCRACWDSTIQTIAYLEH